MKKCSTNFAWIQISKLHEQCILLKWGSWSIPIIKQYQRHQLPSLRIEEALFTTTLTLWYLCEILYWWAGNSSQTHHWTRMSRGLLVTCHQLDASEMHQRPLCWRAEADWRCLCHEARPRLLVMLSWGALKVHCCDRRKVPSNNGIIEEYVKVTKESSLLLLSYC